MKCGTIDEAARCYQHRTAPDPPLDKTERGLAVEATARTCAVPTCDRAPSSRGWCNSHYERWRKTGDVRADEPLVSPSTTCVAPDCGQPTKAKGRLCSKHAARKSRGGSFDKRRHALPSYVHSNGYLVQYLPEHPLADDKHRVFAHRAAVYDALGPGPQPCTDCGLLLTWGDNLHIDHINRDKQNNDLSNLDVVCAPCNARRYLAIRYPKDQA